MNRRPRHQTLACLASQPLSQIGMNLLSPDILLQHIQHLAYGIVKAISGLTQGESHPQ